MKDDFDFDKWFSEMQARLAARSPEEVAKDEAMAAVDAALASMTTTERALDAARKLTPDEARNLMRERDQRWAQGADRWELHAYAIQIADHPIALTMEQLILLEGADVPWLQGFLDSRRQEWHKGAKEWNQTIDEYARRESPDVVAWLKKGP